MEFIIWAESCSFSFRNTKYKNTANNMIIEQHIHIQPFKYFQNETWTTDINQLVFDLAFGYRVIKIACIIKIAKIYDAKWSIYSKWYIKSYNNNGILELQSLSEYSVKIIGNFNFIPSVLDAFCRHTSSSVSKSFFFFDRCKIVTVWIGDRCDPTCSHQTCSKFINEKLRPTSDSWFGIIIIICQFSLIWFE